MASNSGLAKCAGIAVELAKDTEPSEAAKRSQLAGPQETNLVGQPGEHTELGHEEGVLGATGTTVLLLGTAHQQRLVRVLDPLAVVLLRGGPQAVTVTAWMPRGANAGHLTPLLISPKPHKCCLCKLHNSHEKGATDFSQPTPPGPIFSQRHQPPRLTANATFSQDLHYPH